MGSLSTAARSGRSPGDRDCSPSSDARRRRPSRPGVQFNRHMESNALAKMQVEAEVKDTFRRAPKRAMVKARVEAILKMSIELHPCSGAEVSGMGPPVRC